MRTGGREAGRSSGAGTRLAVEDLRRAELIDATISTIAERGFTRSTVRQIAEKAGCSPASVLYYFPKKETLLEVAFAESDQRFRDRVRAELSEFEGAGKLERIIELCFPDDHKSEPAWSVEIDFWAFADQRRSRGNFQEIYAAASSDWLGMLASATHEGIATGELLPATDVQQWAVAFAALIDGLAVHTRVTGHVDSAAARKILGAHLDTIRSDRSMGQVDKGDS
jgi:TetR/AcrR family transcriptional repressor of bet genes